MTLEQTALWGEVQTVETTRPTAESSDPPRQTSVIRECSSVNERRRLPDLRSDEEDSFGGGSLR